MVNPVIMKIDVFKTQVEKYFKYRRGSELVCQTRYCELNSVFMQNIFFWVNKPIWPLITWKKTQLVSQQRW